MSDDDLIRRGDAEKAIALCSAESDSPNAHFVCKEAIKRIRALPASPGVRVWQSFDTAPRDGSRILAKGGGLDEVSICAYNACVGCWTCDSVTLDDTDHEPEGYNRPTEWMPLAALDAPAPDAVEALVWEEQAGKSYRQANCALGQYQVSWLVEFECWQLSRPPKQGQQWRDGFSRHSHKDEAKAAAQADYEARILAALGQEGR